MLAIQLVGLMVGLAALHLTYLYYKRANFSKLELCVWLLIWLVFIFIALFPNGVRLLTKVLHLNRTLDLLMVGAFIILFALTFYNYTVMKDLKNKITKLVQELALKELRKHENTETLEHESTTISAKCKNQNGK